MKQLKNFTEVFVERYLDKWLVECNVCTCEDCRFDIMALMLNKLKPQYVVTEKGALFAQLKEFDAQHRVDMATALAEAINVVSKKPRH